MNLRTLKLIALDAFDLLTGRRPPMNPSRRKIDAIGGGDFRAIGEHLAGLVIGPGALQPHDRILDVACGIGRLAVPLTRYLTTGSYLGFDVSSAAISWCRRAIASKHPNFEFIHSDVYSRHYNSRGRIAAAEFVFPAADASVDVVFMGSILTHLLPEAAAQYVAESARVLRPGGRAVMTFFLLDDAVRARLGARELEPAFIVNPDEWWAVQDPSDPEAAIAFDRAVVERALRDRGLEVQMVSRGMWVGGENPATYQDLVVARK